jgi:hypothetical protein
MRAVITCFAVLLGSCCFVFPVAAEGWQMPNLNPFAKAAPAKPSSYQIKEEGGSSWLPKWSKPSWPSSAGSSMWNKTKAMPGKIASGTKQAVNAVNPFKAAPQPMRPPTTQYSNETKKSSKRWFSPWPDESEEKGPPQTVPDFLAGPRPE